ncbi:MAG: N-acetylmuramoyl-L-alanine amidase [Pikeienuella sp.]|uniref:peptidoglycan recognition protein family protein n=1 Tax=Pikeienuella sp. TaxID=2831957 RepID=UPI003919BE64
MESQLHRRVAALEARVAQAMRGAAPEPLRQSAVDAAPSIEISPDGKRAIGKNGLKIAYRGDDACPYGRSATANRRPLEAVVIHHTGDDHDIDWYVQYQIDGDPGRGGDHFGYHFYVAPDGEVIQGAPLTKRTNHVKPSSDPERKPFGRHANNSNAIGVSCVGAGKPFFSPTPQQVGTSRALALALCDAFGVERASVYGHSELQRDRERTMEGASIAESVRSGLGAGVEDDLDDGPIHAMTARPALHEDADDLDPDAVPWSADPVAVDAAPLGAIAGLATTRLRYTNQNRIRNRPCTANLEERIVEAAEAVFGAGCEINIYSGGQDRLGDGDRRVGSIRHDDFGSGGRAADIHVFDAGGRQIRALELCRLGQYWLAANFGCVGLVMQGGGIHLDEWTTPPPGGGRFWTYAYSDAQPWGQSARTMLARGAQGVFP